MLEKNQKYSEEIAQRAISSHLTFCFRVLFVLGLLIIFMKLSFRYEYGL
jgi:hypothetical protein